MISDYGTASANAKASGRNSLSAGVDYARKIYRDESDGVAVYVGDGSHRSSICFRRVSSGGILGLAVPSRIALGVLGGDTGSSSTIWTGTLPLGMEFL